MAVCLGKVCAQYLQKNSLKFSAIFSLLETIVELTSKVGATEVCCLWGRSSRKMRQVSLGFEDADFSWFLK